MIDFLARERHFLEHLAPIWRALDPEERGTFWVKRGEVAERARALGLDVNSDDPPETTRLTAIASYGDLKYARGLGRLVVYSEHGAGQWYKGVRSGSYTGALDRAGVVGVLTPNRAAADRHQRSHPTIPAYVVGCPKLDAWLPPKPREEIGEPIVAISFHWNCRLINETRNAYGFYKAILPTLAREFPGALGHGHPRFLMSAGVRRWYDRSGFELVDNFDDVLDRADIYVCDNSSTLFEFAATDRPVVVMNAPWYRRNIDHGGRFWEWADVGVQVNRANALIDSIHHALDDPHALADRRRDIVRNVYGGPLDGTAAQRAVKALRSLMKKWGSHGTRRRR